MVRAELLQYDITYDRREKDVQFIAKQLETHLKERFNVLLSTVEYGIKDGYLVRQGTTEPFIESIKRGRDVVQSLSPTNIDFERENAEVIGFEKIDAFLSDSSTPLGAKMLSISPPGGEGSKYKHNFYDIFTLKEIQGKRCVELSRYSSGLTNGEYVQRLGARFRHPPQAHPIEFNVQVTAKQIHRELHKGHEYMEPADFERIWNSAFVQTFVERYQLNRDARSFNAILNAADVVWENRNKREKGQLYEDYSTYLPSFGEIKGLEEKKVRQAGGQCPGKSGADIDNSPFSVASFGLGEDMNYEFDQDGPCKECGAMEVKCGPCGICKSCDLAIRASQMIGIKML